MTRSDAAREEQLMYGSGALTRDELDKKYPNRPHNHSKTLRFPDLFLTLFNPLAEHRKKPTNIAPRRRVGPDGPVNLTPNEARRQIIERFISRWRKEVGNDFYPAMRLMIPDKDRDRAMYGLKESTLGKLLVKVMKINKDSEDGYNLMHWKLPGLKASSAMAGDFAGRCFEVISKRPIIQEPGNLTIAEVNGMLDQLSKAQKEEDQLPIMQEFYNRMNPEELQWLIRMILRQIKIGASEKTILELWHPDAENLFNISSSLRRVCWELYDPEVRLEGDDRGITLMQCFQPQLAAFQMRSMEQMVTRMKLTEDDPVFWIEEKLDGERMQLHMIEDESVEGGKRFSFWSRKAKDYTYLYGEGFHDEKASLTRHIRDAFSDGVRNIILDGEMITWNMKEDKIYPFGHLKTAALLEQSNPYSVGNRPLFKIFDCLYLNDHDLTRYTLRNRREALARSVQNVHRRFEVHEYEEAREASDIEPILRKVVAESSEGLVLKNPRCAYKLNERNDDWIKVKPEYMTEFGEALDCVVIGGYYGSGHRGGNLSSFLCGLKVAPEKIKSDGLHQQACFSFFKVGGGFNAADYANVRHHTDGKWHPWDAKSPPTQWIILGGGERQYEKPDVWIKPEDSLVFEVKAASVTTTVQFGTGYTLRFPRFKKVRDDKDWTTALSAQDFESLKRRAETEQHEKQFKIEDAKKQRRMAKKPRPMTIQGQSEKVQPLSSLQSTIFRDKTFLILSDCPKPKRSKAELEQLVKSNGGSIVASDKQASTIVISDRNVVKAASIIKRGDRNVIRSKWLYDCVRQHNLTGGYVLLPYEPQHMFFVQANDQDEVDSTVDIFGDSYEQVSEVSELRELLQEMSVDDIDLNYAMEQLGNEGLDFVSTPSSFFSGLVAYMDDAQEETQEVFRFASGRVEPELTEDVTHIIVGKDKKKVKELRRRVANAARLPRLVSSEWVQDCWQAKTRLDEERYALC